MNTAIKVLVPAVPPRATAPVKYIQPSAGYTVKSWTNLLLRSMKGEQSTEIDSWKKHNTQSAPKPLVQFFQEMAGSTIPVEKLPSLVAEAGKEVIDDTISMVKFVGGEIKHVVKGEETQTQQAMGIFKLFVNEEAARYQLNQQTQTAKLVQELVPKFNALSQEEKFKELLKVGAAIFNPAAGSMTASSKLTGQVVTVVKKTENTVGPQPVIFSKVVTNYPKDSKNLPELMSKLQKVPGVFVQNGGAKIFTQYYDSKSVTLPSVLKQIEDFSVKSGFDGELYPQSKLTSLVQYLERRGIQTYGTEGNPKFIAMWDGTGQIYLPEKPTVLQVKHELSHYLDFKTYGVHEYVKLTRHQREHLVLERLKNNRLWSGLNDLEKEFSINYVESLAPNNAKRNNHE